MIGNSEFDIPGVLLNSVEQQCLWVRKTRDLFIRVHVRASVLQSGSITDASSSRRCCVIFLSAKENVPNLLLYYPIVLCIPEGASLNSLLPTARGISDKSPSRGK